MIDETDKRLLIALQRDAQQTAQDLAQSLHLSPSQAGRRKQRLEETGIIHHYTASIDAEKVGLTVQAFVQVQLNAHGVDQARQFKSLVSQHPEIISTWTLTGEADYLLRVYCADLKALNRLIHEKLLAHPTVSRVQSQIVMDQIKPDSPLPI